MKKLSLRELQLAEFDILCKFDDFCKNNNLKYYLYGGTLLGAVRHKGFIPWDDDIDVCMPRPDYERFFKLWKNADGLELRSYKLKNTIIPYAKIVDTKTKIIIKRNCKLTFEECGLKSSIDTAVWIDIFPIDGVSDNDLENKKFFKRTKFKTNMGLWGNWLMRSHIAAFLVSPIILFSKLFRLHKLEKKIDLDAQSFGFDKSKYVAQIVWEIKYYGKMPRDEFLIPDYLEFEGRKFPVYSCWDYYLKFRYGDYMQLPPANLRVDHKINAYLID